LNKYRIVYFSGTGCTALAAQSLEKTLRERGCETGLTSIKTDGGGAVNSADAGDGENSAGALVLLFPVYACTAPGPVMEWLANLGKADGLPAAVISVSGGGEVSPNTAGRVSVVKALERKGYDVFCENFLVMPSNIAIATPEPLSVLLLQVLPDKVRALADDLLSGGRKRKTPLFFDRVFARIGKALRGYAKRWGRSTRVSADCDGCGLCAGSCSCGNITMSDSKPGFGNKCCMCLGCFYACPKGALTPKTAKSLNIKGFDLKAAAEKASVAERADAGQIRVGHVWAGVKSYLQGNEE